MDFTNLEGIDNYGMTLVKKGNIKNNRLEDFYSKHK